MYSFHYKIVYMLNNFIKIVSTFISRKKYSFQMEKILNTRENQQLKICFSTEVCV